MPTVASKDTQTRAVVAGSTSRHHECSATNDGLRNRRGLTVAAEVRNGGYLPGHPWRREKELQQVGAAPLAITRRVLGRVERQRGLHGA